MLCSVGFGLLAGQLGSFCITSGLGFTLYCYLGLVQCFLLTVLSRFTLETLTFFFLDASALSGLLSYHAFAINAILLGLLFT